MSRERVATAAVRGRSIITSARCARIDMASRIPGATPVLQVQGQACRRGSLVEDLHSVGQKRGRPPLRRHTERIRVINTLDEVHLPRRLDRLVSGLPFDVVAGVVLSLHRL